ncbi:MAG: hypothetical protein Q9218_006051, partial [Villophora microphyllina]
MAHGFVHPAMNPYRPGRTIQYTGYNMLPGVYRYDPYRAYAAWAGGRFAGEVAEENFDRWLAARYFRSAPFPAAFEMPGSRLYNLPNEIILKIGSDLAPHNRLALSRTCHHLRNLFCFHPLPFGILAALHEMAPNLAVADIDQEKDLFLSLVERDDPEYQAADLQIRDMGNGSFFARANAVLRRDNKIWCASCRHKHPAFMFSQKMRSVWRHRRKCIGTEGKMWICPHKHVIHYPPHGFIANLKDDCDDLDHQVRFALPGVTLTRLIQLIGPTTTNLGRLLPVGIDTKVFENRLKTRNVNICPHFLISSPHVIENAIEYLPILRNPFRQYIIHYASLIPCKKPKDPQPPHHSPWRHHNWCPYCQTTWGFIIVNNHAATGQKAICLEIFRPYD